MNYLALLGGGLGDALQEYLTHPLFRRARALKAIDPSMEIHVFAAVHNDGFNDFFFVHPYVTRCVLECQLMQGANYHVMQPFVLPGTVTWAQAPLNGLPEEEPEFYLLEQEQRFVDDLCANGPFVIIQPFAGLDNRNAFNDTSLKRLIERLPVRALILGKNHIRGCKQVREDINFTHPNMVNLIDRCGIRVGMHLMKRCHAFIGSHSSLILMAYRYGIRSSLVLPMPNQEAHWGRLDPRYKPPQGADQHQIVHFHAPRDVDVDQFNYETLEVSNIVAHVSIGL